MPGHGSRSSNKQFIRYETDAMNNEINNEMHNVAQEQQNASNAEEPVQYLTFTLDGEAFATEISRVREVLEYTQVTPVPRTPDYMQGVINLRGSVVPVVDMRLQFAMPAGKKTVDTCIIIIEVSIDGQLLVLGALADSVQEVIDLRAEQLQPAPSLGTRINNEFISAMAKVDEGFVIVLDMDEVFTIDPDLFSNTSYSYQDVAETQVTDATVKEEQQQDTVDKTNTADTNTAKQAVEIDLDSAIAKHA
jgi:purine-binding chemotaxis protein CheW